MKKLFLSIFCISLLLNQSVRPEPSWAEKILNPKILLAGLGIVSTIGLVSNFLWWKACAERDQEIDELESEKKNLKEKHTKLQAVCNEAQRKIDKLKVYRDIEKKSILPGVRDSASLVIEFDKYQRLVPAVRNHYGVDAIYDYDTYEWSFLDPRALSPEPIEVTVINKITISKPHKKTNTIEHKKFVNLLTEQKNKTVNDNTISISKKLAAEAVNKKHALHTNKK